MGLKNPAKRFFDSLRKKRPGGRFVCSTFIEYPFFPEKTTILKKTSEIQPEFVRIHKISQVKLLNLRLDFYGSLAYIVSTK